MINAQAAGKKVSDTQKEERTCALVAGTPQTEITSY